MSTNLQGNGNNPVTFIPYIFKSGSTKSNLVNPADPFLTDSAGREFCSLLSTNEDKLPNYLRHFKSFTDNVLNFSEKTLEDISKMHMERELAFREEELKVEAANAKLLENEMNEKRKLDKKINSIMRVHKFFVKRSCPVRIPFKSTLSHEEHEFYLMSFIKFQSRPPVNTLEEREHAQYLSMQNRVFDEQSCMMNFSYKVSQLVLNQYNALPSSIETFIREYVNHRCQRALNYPGNYKTEIEIPLRPMDMRKTTPDHFELNHIGHLLSLGFVPWLKLPNFHVRTDLPKDENFSISKRLICDQLHNRKTFLHKCPVSEDPNAEFLAKAHNASIVMSASAFKTIVDNQEQPFDKEWNIPVTIRSYTKKDENGKEVSSRIIYIDKPLPKKTWFPLQKKQTFYKHSAKFKLTKVNKHACFKMRNEVHQQTRNYRDLDSSFSDYSGNDYQPINRQERAPQGAKRKFPSKDVVLNDLFLTDDDTEAESAGSDRETSEAAERSKQPKLDFAPPSFYHSEDRNQNPKHRNIPPNPIQGSSTHNQSTQNQSLHNQSSPNQGPHNSSTPNQSTQNQRPHTSTHNKSHLNESPQSPHNSSALYKSPHKQSPQNKSPHSADKPAPKSNSEDEHSGFLDDLLNKQSSFLKPKTVRGPASERLNPSLTPLLAQHDSKTTYDKQSLYKPWSTNHMKTNWSNHTLKDCPMDGTNVHYQLFSFERTEQSPIKHERSEPVRIIIRHNVHGLTRFKKHPKKSRAYVIYPKMENQVYFGCEVNSLSEIVQQWAALITRPSTYLLQVRVCVESGSIVMVEEKSLPKVLKEGKQNHLNFNPQTVYSTLNVLFNILIKMSSGNYLLHHSTKTEAFMKLFKAIGTDNPIYNSHYDMHKFYTDGMISHRMYKAPPWLAIDTHVLTPFHMFHRKIPATFPMEMKRKLTKHERKKIRANANKKLSVDGF